MSQTPSKAIVLRRANAERKPAPWGELTFLASGQLGNSTEMTLAQCVIKPGMSNPLHFHPNSSEILTVVSGVIMHTIENGAETRMEAGDTITIPAKMPHQARNIGDANATLMVVFPTPNRQVENE